MGRKCPPTVRAENDLITNQASAPWKAAAPWDSLGAPGYASFAKGGDAYTAPAPLGQGLTDDGHGVPFSIAFSSVAPSNSTLKARTLLVPTRH